MREHGFGLVVGRMGHGDARRAALGGEALEKSVAKAPRRILEIPAVACGSGRDILSCDDEFKLARMRQLRDESRLRVRLRAPERMIEMHHEQSDTQRLAKAFQQAQKSDRIRAAGYGDSDTVPGGHHLRAAGGFQNLLFERRFHGLKCLCPRCGMRP